LVVEGLGPPKRPHEGDEALEIKAYRDMLLSRVAARPSSGKPIIDIEDVVGRLCRNNPRLDPNQAGQIAPHLVTEVDGALSWAFDSRANSVFVGSNYADNARFWRQVQAPTCLISGTLSYQYWGREMASPDFNGHFAEGEMEARADHFANHEHHWFEHSGHMVHYDEPDRLGVLARNFLEQNYV
jgi:pimeloyl-ACP methyl ester carboxylesterase